MAVLRVEVHRTRSDSAVVDGEEMVVECLFLCLQRTHLAFVFFKVPECDRRKVVKFDAFALSGLKLSSFGHKPAKQNF